MSTLRAINVTGTKRNGENFTIKWDGTRGAAHVRMTPPPVSEYKNARTGSGESDEQVAAADTFHR